VPCCLDGILDRAGVVVELAHDQPAVVQPLGQAVRHGAAHTRQRLSQARDVPWAARRARSVLVRLERPLQALLPT
jgi:hypothetical protein